jgi:hypothetical protein
MIESTPELHHPQEQSTSGCKGSDECKFMSTKTDNLKKVPYLHNNGKKLVGAKLICNILIAVNVVNTISSRCNYGPCRI